MTLDSINLSTADDTTLRRLIAEEVLKEEVFDDGLGLVIKCEGGSRPLPDWPNDANAVLELLNKFDGSWSYHSMSDRLVLWPTIIAGARKAIESSGHGFTRNACIAILKSRGGKE